MTDYPKAIRRPTRKTGITVECVGCKGRETLSFEAAAALTDTPMCKACLLPMVAIEASR